MTISRWRRSRVSPVGRDPRSHDAAKEAHAGSRAHAADHCADSERRTHAGN